MCALEFRRDFCHEHVRASTSIAFIEPTLSWSMTFFAGVKERELGCVLSALLEDWCCAPKFAESTTSCQCAHANMGTWYRLHAYLARLLFLVRWRTHDCITFSGPLVIRGGTANTSPVTIRFSLSPTATLLVSTSSLNLSEPLRLGARQGRGHLERG